jgi:hypothetical protein
MGPLVVLWVLLENYWQDNVLGGYFINFNQWSKSCWILNYFYHWKLIKNQKNIFPPINASSSYCYLNSHLLLHITWWNAFAFSCLGEMHEESPIDHLNQSMHLHVTWGNAFASMSWRNAWGVSHWPSPSSHLAISTNQCLFMWGEKMHLLKMHLLLYVMGEYIKNLLLSHFKQSMPFHVMGKYIENISFSHFKQSMPFHVTWKYTFTSSSHEKLCEKSSIDHPIYPFIWAPSYFALLATMIKLLFLNIINLL